MRRNIQAGTLDEIAIQEDINTRKGVDRIIVTRSSIASVIKSSMGLRAAGF